MSLKPADEAGRKADAAANDDAGGIESELDVGAQQRDPDRKSVV